MADVYAIANGNWSDPAIWNGGIVPGTADNVWLNGKTITLDQDISIASLSSEANATLGTVAGGTLDIPNTYSTRSITASGDIRQGGSTALIQFTASTSLIINCTAIYSSDVSGTAAIYCTSTLSNFYVTITGNVIAKATSVIGSGSASSANITINGSTWSVGSGVVIPFSGFSVASCTINGNVKNGTADGKVVYLTVS
ncbi:MAG: hypothetical protein KatS3mg038_3172 [Candidatus Kapaibacterium sp.]|nr:MAG: hypothetical protein KatS3mg038_3172 [Candidatus Kapabacteria bacterium]